MTSSCKGSLWLSTVPEEKVDAISLARAFFGPEGPSRGCTQRPPWDGSMTILGRQLGLSLYISVLVGIYALKKEEQEWLAESTAGRGNKMFKSLKQRTHGKIRMSDQQVFCVRFLLCDAERWENYQEIAL